MNIIKRSRLFLGALLMSMIAGICFASNEISDSMITLAVKAKYTADTQLNPIDIKVSTHSGVVKLVGVVESDTEFERAVMTANSVDGVRDIDTDNLTIKQSEQPISDLLITAKVKGKLIKEELFGDKEVGYWSVSIETRNGVVHLSGEVDSDADFQHAAMIANSIDGVRDIDTANLTIKQSEQPMSDLLITAKVKGKLIKEELFGDKEVGVWSVSIETKNGVVHLSGTADSETEKKNIVDVVKTMHGVESVNATHLKVIENH